MADLRKLKDEASEAATKGNWKKAAGLYATLEQHERNGLWPLKLGECLRKQGHKAEAIKALTRAVDIFAKADLLLKAIAVCKIILDIDPTHTKTQQALAAFHASHSGPQAGVAALLPVPAAGKHPSTPAGPLPRRFAAARPPAASLPVGWPARGKRRLRILRRWCRSRCERASPRPAAGDQPVRHAAGSAAFR